tara:strand:- start:351 stop:578 length:228 start_codon:yes stop_codon:yes gene_type:complete
VKTFWPQRSKARGFLIENLALKCRKKIAGISSKETKNQFIVDNNSRAINHKEDSQIPRKKGHWANRDFSEYEKVY